MIYFFFFTTFQRDICDSFNSLLTLINYKALFSTIDIKFTYRFCKIFTYLQYIYMVCFNIFVNSVELGFTVELIRVERRRRWKNNR